MSSSVEDTQTTLVNNQSRPVSPTTSEPEDHSTPATSVDGNADEDEGGTQNGEPKHETPIPDQQDPSYIRRLEAQIEAQIEALTKKQEEMLRKQDYSGKFHIANAEKMTSSYAKINKNIAEARADIASMAESQYGLAKAIECDFKDCRAFL